MAYLLPGKARFWGWFAVLLLCAACLGRSTDVPAAQSMLPAALSAPSMPLLPSLDYLIDETGTMDVEEVAASGNAQAFRPLVLKDLPRETGVTWLRFTLAPLPEGERPGTILLDMGESVPGVPLLYEPVLNALSGTQEWRETSPAQRNVFLLPEAGKEALTCYIRLDGLPGLWFAPMLRTPQDAAGNWGSLARTAAMLTLGVVMLLCLLRGLSEKGQWRIWTALYVAVALVQALIGMPADGSGHVSLGEAAGILAPGVALMLLPHVGRHLMHTRSRSRALDIQLLLLSLPGALLALLPLLPAFGWLTRYLDLWPLGTLLFVPSALGAWIMGLSGAKRFLLGCLLPPLFVAGGILGLDSGYAANLLASAPFWGTALSALIIAATRTPRDAAVENDADFATGPGKKARKRSGGDSAVITLDQPLDDPNLRLVSPPPDGDSDDALDSTSSPTPDFPSGSLPGLQPGLLEDALRLPLDRLMREGAALGHCALPPAVRQYAERMLDAARNMADIISNPNQLNHERPQAEPHTPFNLQHLMREAHDTVAPAAETAGIGLAWYMPPHLGHMYEGEAKALSDTLCLLLESAVRATRHGAVHFSVRRVPESADAGHLLFTVTDTGSGMPPQNRSSLALTRAWELAGAHKGFLGVECSPHGTTIAFTLHLKYLEREEADAAQKALPHVIIAAEGSVDRQLLAHMLESLPCRSSEARGLAEALQLHQVSPALLLVVRGRLAGPAAAALLQQFRELAEAFGLPFCKALAVTPDDSQWDALADAGFTHALLEPVDSEAFCRTVSEILDEAAPSVSDREAGETPEQTSSTQRPAAEATVPGGMTADAPLPSENTEALAGRPPLPDLFGSESNRDSASPLKIPDLTALPDLLSFAESLRGPLGDMDQSRAKPTGGLFSDLPSPSAAPDGLNTPITRLDGAKRENSPSTGIPSGLFVNPYAPDELVMGATAKPSDAGVTPGGEAAGSRLSARPEPQAASSAGETAVTEAPAAAQAEFSASAGLEGPVWSEEAPQDDAAGQSEEQLSAPASSLAEPEENSGPAAALSTAASTLEPAPEKIPAQKAAEPEPAAEPTADAAPDKPLAGTEEKQIPSVPVPETTIPETKNPELPEPGQAVVDTDATVASPPADDTPKPETPPAGAAPIAPEKAVAQPKDNAAATPSAAPEVAPQELPKPKPAPRVAFSVRSKPARPAPSETYTSPALSTPGEWVGEPMPVGSPVAAGETRKKPSMSIQAPQARNPQKSAAPTPKAAPAANREPAAYTSPSLSSPGEWVGEPMPVPPKSKADAPAEAGAASRSPGADEPRLQSVKAALDLSLTNAQVAAKQVAASPGVNRPGPKRPESPAVGVQAQAAAPAPSSPETRPQTPAAVRPSVEPLSPASSSDATDSGSFMDFIAGAAPAQSASAHGAPTVTVSAALSPSRTEAAPKRPEPEPAAPKEAERPTPPIPADPAAPGEPAPAVSPPSQEVDRPIMLLVERLDAAMEDAQKGFQSRRGFMVGEAAGRIASESEAYGFRVLARMARCVEQAAKANDMSALKDLLPELAVAVERNRIALTPRK